MAGHCILYAQALSAFQSVAFTSELNVLKTLQIANKYHHVLMRHAPRSGTHLAAEYRGSKSSLVVMPNALASRRSSASSAFKHDEDEVMGIWRIKLTLNRGFDVKRGHCPKIRLFMHIKHARRRLCEELGLVRLKEGCVSFGGGGVSLEVDLYRVASMPPRSASKRASCSTTARAHTGMANSMAARARCVSG